MTRAFILSARRAIVAPWGGALSDLDAHAIAAPVLRACLDDAGVPAGSIDLVIAGDALGAGGNPARVAALAAGLPETVPGLTLDSQCCAGLDAVLTARAMVAAGQADLILAGGLQSYSRRPLRAHRGRDGAPDAPYEQARFTPWPDRDPDMAAAADALARRYDVSRERQDAWAVESHAKALAAQEALAAECVPLAPDHPRTDPFARRLSPAVCRRARPIHGTITHANACVAADGAAFCLVASERAAARAEGPILEILGGRARGGDPELPGLAPVAAISELNRALSLKPTDFAAIELMEAYAVQAILCAEHAELPLDRVNRKGGALARGHPIGASGAILATRLFHDLRPGEHGLAAIAAAGGLGTAAAFQAVEALKI